MTTGMMDVAHLYLSMEIGGTNLRYGVLDETFRVLDFKKEPSRYLSDAEDKIHLRFDNSIFPGLI